VIDVFQVGVRIAMSSNGTQVIGVLLRDMAKVEASAVSIRTKLGLVGGAIAALGGAAVLKGLWDIIEASKDLNKELEKTKLLGGDFAKNLPQTRANAFEISRNVPTTTASEAVRAQREVSMTLGDPEIAEKVTPDVLKAAYAAARYTGEKPEEMIKNMLRTADARGQIYSMGADGKEHIDAAKLVKELNAEVKGLELAGGLLKSNDVLNAVRQGGPAMKGQETSAFITGLIETAMAMGGSKTGTAEMGLYQQIIGGTMTKKIAENLTSAGFMTRDEWKSGKSGGVVVSPKVAARNHDMMEDPVAWLETGKGHDVLTRYAQQNGLTIGMAIMQLFGRQTTQRLVSDVTSNAPQYERARKLYPQIANAGDQYKELQDHDFETNTAALSAAFKTLMEALGDAGIPTAIGILHSLTDGIHFLTDVVVAHPTIASDLMLFAGGLAAVTALSGSILVVTTALGPFAAGIRLLVGALSAAEVATAATSATTLATGITTVSAAIVAGVAAIAGLAATIAIIAKIGSDYETPENRARLEHLRKDRGNGSPTDMTPQDGFGPDGRPIARPQSYRAPAEGEAKPIGASYHLPGDGGARPIQVHSEIKLDGRTVGRAVTNHQADMASRPQRGPTGYDPSLTPSFPSNWVPA